ncbi:MAG: UPF0182 family protein [Anaerolineae bacterium]|nr:UPF0182 family protein [Anaerolineae bacterium]MDW8070701.1 UPF0182 family protein [Anaerolineae bacterium]
MWVVLILLLAVLLILSNGITFYTDYLWYRSVGFSNVFLISLTTRLGVFFGAAIPFVMIFLGNMLLARYLSTRQPLYRGQTRALDAPIWGWLIGIGALFLGVLVGLAAAPRWLDFQRFFHQVPFGVADPLFGLDVAFFVFSLPVYQFLQGWLITVLLLTLLGVGLLYFVAQLPHLRDGTASILPHVRLHISALGAALFVAIAWGHNLAAYDLVYSPRGVAFGASYTDVHVELVALRVMFWIALLIALMLLANVYLRRLWWPIIGAAAWMIIALFTLTILPGIVQRYVVEPSELALEAPYIAHNIASTRQAYGLDRIEERNFERIAPLTAELLSEHQATLQNVRLWDYRPLSETYRQIQEIRPYYRFKDLDVDRYYINGDYRQVIIAARELDQSRLQSPTWVNQHLQFTHGYGVVMNPVNEVLPEGLPPLWIRDLPPIITVPITLTRPEIYFGELTDNYVFVNTGIEEFDYPRGEENVYTTYQEESGILLDSYFKRLAWSLRLADINVLLSNYITPQSRLLINRQIHERVKLVAPFLRYDADPYIVIWNGRLYWIHDAYTVTDRYPYSEPVSEEINYIRNSVKVVTDAYNGTMTFYIVDDDPLVRTYAAIFPGLFTPGETMPEGLRAHLRYPEGLFNVQAAMYRTYHMGDVNVFYNKEDLWNIPRELFAEREQLVEPYYVTLQLPGGMREEFMLILPYTPANKDNLIAWIAGRCDDPYYGRLVVYRFPKQELIFGPRQIEARIDQVPEISAQLTLWGQRGSRVIRGNLLVIPLGYSLLYVEPLYLQAEQGQIPELKRVIVASGDRIVMSETLERALVELVGKGPSIAERSPVEAGTQFVESGGEEETLKQQVYELARQADAHYSAAQSALQRSDWARYGEEMAAVERLIKQLVTLTQPPLTPTSTPTP